LRSPQRILGSFFPKAARFAPRNPLPHVLPPHWDCGKPSAMPRSHQYHPSTLCGFRDKLRQEGLSATTCNMVVKKVLSIPFEAARKLGFIPINPVAAVDNLRDTGARSGPSHSRMRRWCDCLALHCD
jgi:hypothetical protein